MRDGIIIFSLCLVAIIIGGWLFFYAPNNLAVFPRADIEQAAYAPSGSSQAAAVEVAFSEVASGTQAKIEEQKNYAVRALDAFTDIWKQMGNPPPAPEIDFTKSDVIAVFAGQKPTGGYSIKIEKVTDMSDKRIVSIVLTEPGKNCVTNQLITSPFDLVVAPASALVPVREERIVTEDCP